MEISDKKKLIEVQNLKKYYNGESIRALDGVSIDINKGDVMVVIGHEGGQIPEQPVLVGSYRVWEMILETPIEKVSPVHHLLLLPKINIATASTG